jgi:hypothetical protein
VIWLKITTFLSKIEQLNPFGHFKIDPDLNGLERWMDKKMISNGLEAICFHNHFR